jgi:UDP-N-acetylglucosamine:LPS N-acetylglucosamine transferase
MDTDKPKLKKILILYARAGNGHYSQAKSLQEYLLKFAPNQFEIKLVDGLAGNSEFTQKRFTEGYQLLTSKFYWLWKATYFVYENKFLFGFLSVFLKLSSQKYLQKIIDEFGPDLVVDTYYFFAYLNNKNSIKSYQLVKLITDIFSPAKAAFFGKNANYIVYSEEALKIGEETTSSQIYLTPPLVSVNFPSTKKDHALKTQKLLILAGGDSFPNSGKILNSLKKLNPKIQVTVVCGRNQILLEKVTNLKAQNNLENWEIFGFSNEVPRLISESGLVITKAGPATIWEILSLKKPMVLTSYIWKQELGNKDFVVNQKVGIYEPNPDKLYLLVEDFFTNPKNYSLMLENLKKLDLPTQNSDLANYFLSL